MTQLDWTADVQPFDAVGILRTLDAHDVRYVLVGGVAAITHGYSGATFDADVVPDRPTTTSIGSGRP